MSITDVATPREVPTVPHGGRLVDRRLDAEEAAELVQGAPSLILSPAEAADLRALATGVYSPLTGFMGSAEHEACTHTMRLPDGLLWPVPVCLGVPDGARIRGDRLALRDVRGRPLGVLEVREVYERDQLGEAERVLGPATPPILVSPGSLVGPPWRLPARSGLWSGRWTAWRAGTR